MRRSVLSGQSLSSSSSDPTSLHGHAGSSHANVSPVACVERAHGALRRMPTNARKSLSGFLWAATLCGATGVASAADVPGQLIPVDEFKVRWQRPVGLPEFENPRDNVARIELASAAYLAAVGGTDGAGLLAPMPLTLLNKSARLAAVVRTPEADASGKPIAESGPEDFADATMVLPGEISKFAQGAYQSALAYLVARADAWLGSPAAESDGALADAVAEFRNELSSVTTRSLENQRLAVRLGLDAQKDSAASGSPIAWFYDTRTPVDGEQLVGTQQETLTLPRVTTGFRVDSRSLTGLANQFESALEENLVLSSDSGAVRLDFEVAARPIAGSRAVELTVAFVGPAAAPAIPVKSFALNYRGGNGAMLKTAPAGAGADGAASDAFFDLPSADSVLGATTVTLYRVRNGEQTFLTDWAADACAAEAVPVRLDTVFEQPEMFSIGALQAVFQAVLVTLQSEEGDGGVPGGDLIGVFVDADDAQLDLGRGCLDIRPADANGIFAIKAVPGVVNSVRTIAAGERVAAEERVNSPYPRFDRLRENAPFQPGSETPQVLREAPLREFLDRQSRHPNRRVDAAITAAEVNAGTPGDAGSTAQWSEQGTVGVDFLVTENKPWTIFVQGSNTGVEATGEWQTRVGYFNSDLFGNDEILSIEYVTTNFSDSNAINAYFDAPVGDSDTLRWKAFAGWSEYTASDVGFVFADFEGESPRIGAEIAWNVAQWGKTFLDLVGGVSWTNVEVFNGLTLDRGDESFIVPYLGARLQRNNRDATTDFALFLEFGVGSNSSVAELNRLGRLFPDQDWQILRWDFAQSFYIDPLFQDPSDVANATLAHELYFRFHGQNSLGSRLVPQFMGTAGGFYTVRGYPTSFIAGDNLYLFTGEYRLHLPQILGIDPNPQPFMGFGTEPFRLRPQFGYGPTDWDFIIRAFVDAGIVENQDRLSFEFDEDLVGAGFGVELQMYKGLGYPTLRNMSLRLDIGFPLTDPDFTDVDGSQLTFVGTLSF